MNDLNEAPSEPVGDSRAADDLRLVLDSLDFFRDWLCGVGLTSPGLLLSSHELRGQLERLETVRSNVQTADSTGRLRFLNEDIKLIRSAVELYLEEAECLGAFFHAPVDLKELQAVLDRFRT